MRDEMGLVNYRVFDREKTGRVFLIIFTLSIIYSAGILLSGRFYIDDLGRSLYGYTNWGYDGRPLSDFIMSALSFGTPILDLSPLYQILSMAALSFSLAAYGKKYFHGKDFIVSSVALFFFISTPFYIENLSYKYDSLPMALSLSAIIIPFSLRFGKVQFAALLIGVICSLSLYQASLSLFLILSAIDIVFILTREKIENKIRLLLKRAICYASAFIFAFAFYKLVITKISSGGGYAQQHSALISINNSFIHDFMNNLNRIIDWFFIPLYKSAEMIFDLYAALIWISIAIISSRSYKATCSRVFCFLCITLLLLLSFTASFIHISILKEPVFATRVLISFTGFVLFSSFLIVHAFKSRTITLLLFFPFFLLTLVFSYSYANASNEQDKVDSLLSRNIQYDVSRLNQDFKYVTIKGVMPSAESKRLVSNKFPIMNSLIPIYMNGDWAWGAMMLKHYGLNFEKKSYAELKQSTDICSSAPLINSQVYSLYGFGNTLLISFDKKACE